MVNIGRAAPVDPTPVSLTIDGVSVDYGGPAVLSDVSLKVTPGEILALLGPSGCGKTTLLRAIAGLERPTTGSISLGARIVSGPGEFVPPERRRIGMVFQDWALFPHLDVAKNVGYGLPRGEQSADRIRETLDLVGLEAVADRMPGTLSGGQQQRVALARALAPRPSVLLMDEPFSNLDSTLRSQVRTEIHHLLVELGVTTVFVTHDQDEAFVLGNRVAVLHDGHVAQVGSPDDLYRRPAHRWIATFVGEANLFPVEGPCSETGDGPTCVTPIGRVPLITDLTGPTEVMLRPEDLAVSPGDDGVIKLVEYYGHDAMVLIQMDDGTPVRARTDAGVSLQRGDRVGVTYDGPGVFAL
ncbi:MAG: ABC transporter ATP-binding protein [Acidimicrobiia bacterium]|nr:ABC transporter ATP-binding protein [Actinomycetota bacterium]MBL6927329.1 ABC transporter ATP-binding protein [Acidimicrobiia bacterium]